MNVTLSHVSQSHYMYIYRASLKKVGLAYSSLFCVVALLTLSFQGFCLYFHKIEFIVIILSRIDFLSSKRCRDINTTFYTSRAHFISLAFSQRLVNIVLLIAQSHIPVTY
jgi:hypothetical protein